MEKKAYVINEYELDIFADKVISKDSLEHFKATREISIEHLKRVTKAELVKALGIDTRNIDYALPQALVDEVFTRTGYYMSMDFVFMCGSDYYGPIPVTDFGKKILPILAYMFNWGIDWVIENIIDRNPKI